ncbi:hypothetical protein LBMAG39_08650 [Cyanobium sp.]|nr:hypothetical protein LBMAG39_08650 [Cyanobium sp.]
MAIEALPHQGDEQLSGGQLTAIGADGAHRRGRINTAAAGLAPQADQIGQLQQGCGGGCGCGVCGGCCCDWCCG